MTAGFAFIDTETTGTHGTARVIEIAVLTFSANGKRTGEYSQLLCADGSAGAPAAQRVHGIRDADLVGQPSFAKVWPHVAGLLDGNYVFAHNAGFDRARMNYELQRIRRRQIESMGCTMQLAYDLGYARRKRGATPGIPAKLGDLVERLDLPVRPTHRALADTEAARALFMHFRKHHRREIDAYLGSIEPFRLTDRHGGGPAPRAQNATSVRPRTREATKRAANDVEHAVACARGIVSDILSVARAGGATTLEDLSLAAAAAADVDSIAQASLESARRRRRHADDLRSSIRRLELEAANAQRRSTAIARQLSGFRRLFMNAERHRSLRADLDAEIATRAALERRLSSERAEEKRSRRNLDRELTTLRREAEATKLLSRLALDRERKIARQVSALARCGFPPPDPNAELVAWAAGIRAELSRIRRTAASKSLSEGDAKRLASIKANVT